MFESGPQLAFETLLGLVDRALVGAGREVLPTAVGDHKNDVGCLALAQTLRCLSQRCVQDRAGGDAGWQTFLDVLAEIVLA